MGTENAGSTQVNGAHTGVSQNQGTQERKRPACSLSKKLTRAQVTAARKKEFITNLFNPVSGRRAFPFPGRLDRYGKGDCKQFDGAPPKFL